jgi:hypothetical protein
MGAVESSGQNADEQWSRIAADLSAHREAQRRAWGEVDEAAIARFVTGEAPALEAARVEQAMRDYPRVRECVESIRAIMADRPRESSSAPAPPAEPILPFAPRPRARVLRPGVVWALASAAAGIVIACTLLLVMPRRGAGPIVLARLSGDETPRAAVAAPNAPRAAAALPPSPAPPASAPEPAREPEPRGTAALSLPAPLAPAPEPAPASEVEPRVAAAPSLPAPLASAAEPAREATPPANSAAESEKLRAYARPGPVSPPGVAYQAPESAAPPPAPRPPGPGAPPQPPELAASAPGLPGPRPPDARVSLPALPESPVQVAMVPSVARAGSTPPGYAERADPAPLDIEHPLLESILASPGKSADEEVTARGVFRLRRRMLDGSGTLSKVAVQQCGLVVGGSRTDPTAVAAGRGSIVAVEIEVGLIDRLLAHGICVGPRASESGPDAWDKHVAILTIRVLKGDGPSREQGRVCRINKVELLMNVDSERILEDRIAGAFQTYTLATASEGLGIGDGIDWKNRLGKGFLASAERAARRAILERKQAIADVKPGLRPADTARIGPEPAARFLFDQDVGLTYRRR